MWQSDEPVADVLDLWDRCERSAAATTGIWPVVSGLFLYGPIRPQRLRKPAGLGAVDVESKLEATWRALRASQLSGFDPTGYPEDLDDVENSSSPRERDGSTAGRPMSSGPAWRLPRPAQGWMPQRSTGRC
jgi:hypothetical protein